MTLESLWLSRCINRYVENALDSHVALATLHTRVMSRSFAVTQRTKHSIIAQERHEMRVLMERDLKENDAKGQPQPHRA